MAPTVPPGGLIEVIEFAQLPVAKSRIRRGDVIEYQWPPDTSKRFVHRVVGLPGEVIAMRGGRLLVDGKVVTEPYAWREGSGSDSASKDFGWQREYLASSAAKPYAASRVTWGPLRIPNDAYFVLGDNRDNSLDSRWSGMIPASHLRGIVQLK